MTNPIQLLRDFRKWRQEKYTKNFDKTIEDIVYTCLVNAEGCGERNAQISTVDFGKMMLRYGIKHRKEILKQVKI